MRTLIYHDITAHAQRDAVGFQGPLAARYKLDPDAFESHLQALQDTGLRIGAPSVLAPSAAAAAAGASSAVAPSTVEPSAGAPAPQVLLSFDDGGSSAMLVADALERRGWRGQFFVTTGRIGTPGFLSAEQLRELVRRGHAIGSHSHSHPTYMGKLSRSELDREWTRSRAVLEELLGAPPLTASVPGGYLSKAVIASAAAAGYELLFTSEPTARVDELEIVVRGRYTIWSTTPAPVAAAYARGDRLACGRLWLEWNAKKLAKRVSPSAYQALRRLRAGRA